MVKVPISQEQKESNERIDPFRQIKVWKKIRRDTSALSAQVSKANPPAPSLCPHKSTCQRYQTAHWAILQAQSAILWPSVQFTTPRLHPRSSFNELGRLFTRTKLRCSTRLLSWRWRIDRGRIDVSGGGWLVWRREERWAVKGKGLGSTIDCELLLLWMVYNDDNLMEYQFIYSMKFVLIYKSWPQIVHNFCFNPSNI